MKLCLIIISCISATTYCAEKPLNADKIIRKAHATGKPIPQETVNKIMQQQQDFLKQQSFDMARVSINSYIHAQQPIPKRIIRMADQESAALATAHNTNLLQQKIQEQK